MEKDVLIHINGMRYADVGGTQEPVEVIAPGQYYYKNGMHYLVFEEVDDELGDKNRSLMKFKNTYLEVTRRGAITTQMVFDEKKKTRSFYGTPFGALNIGIATTSVKCEESADSVAVTANYSLEINDDFVADCKICLTARSKTGDKELLS